MIAPEISTVKTRVLMFTKVPQSVHKKCDFAEGGRRRTGEWKKRPCGFRRPVLKYNRIRTLLGVVIYVREKSCPAAEWTSAAAGASGLCLHHEIPGELLTDGIRSVDLEELYRQADVISLHCPLSEKNTGMINKQSIARMKDGVFLINTARGPLINEADLKEALESGKVGGAAVDVISREPAAADNPLLKAPNMIITPHIAWAPREARQRLMDITVENMKAYLDGRPIHVVNM